MKRIMWGHVLLSLLLGLAACSDAAAIPSSPIIGTPIASAPPTVWPTSTPELISRARFERAPCAFVLPEDYKTNQRVECGYLLVPENRGQLPSRTIRLAVGIFHPEGGATQPDPIIFLAGGPGGSALEFIRYQFEAAFEPILAAQRDLIVFDQRGVGVSRPALDCPAFDKLALDLADRKLDGQPLSEQQVADLLVEELAACAQDLIQVADLSAYNSVANAADVNDLRLALGYQQVNLWGGSYGTRLALEVMRAHPEGIRSVVLDSVYPPDVDLCTESPANTSRAFNRVFESCAANPVCNASYPNLRAVFFDTVERLNDAPLTTIITDTLTGESHVTVFNGNALVGFVFTVLYETDFRFLLPQLIYDASQNDLKAIDRIRGALLAQRQMISRGMTFSVQCHEEVSFSSPEKFKSALAQYPELAGFYEYAATGGLIYRICAKWDSGQAEASQNQSVTSDIPALVMSGEFDPITPPAWGRRAAQTLKNSFFFEYPGVGHGVGTTYGGCPLEMMLDFINDPSARPDDACIAEMVQP